MAEQRVDIKTPDGRADALIFKPDGSDRLPGVIRLTDIRGVRPSQVEAAQRLAAAGYTVLMPNVYYRTGRPPLWDFPLNFGDEKTMKRFGELTGPLPPAAVERDASAYIDDFAAHAWVRPGSLAVVGHCFTGAVALRFAAARPDAVAAVASFHGGGLYTDKPDSPHLVLPRVKAQLYFAHAVEDRSMNAEAIQHFEQALRDWGGRFESETYAGAHHGWTSADSPVYNQAASERAFEKLVELLRRTLG